MWIRRPWSRPPVASQPHLPPPIQLCSCVRLGISSLGALVIAGSRQCLELGGKPTVVTVMLGSLPFKKARGRGSRGKPMLTVVIAAGCRPDAAVMLMIARTCCEPDGLFATAGRNVISLHGGAANALKKLLVPLTKGCAQRTKPYALQGLP